MSSATKAAIANLRFVMRHHLQSGMGITTPPKP
jgi:hypothetical protein